MQPLRPPRRPARTPAAARAAADWLDSEDTFRSLAARVDRLVAIQARIATAFPRVPLGVVSLEGDTLTLRTPNAAWAARLRQSAPTLLAAVRPECAQVTRIRIVPRREADPAAGRRPEPRAPVPAPALAALDHLRAGVDASPLGQALARLVRHQRRGAG